MVKSFKPHRQHEIVLLSLTLALTWATVSPVFAGAADSAKEADTAAPAAKDADAKTDPNDKRPYSKEAVNHYNRGVELHQSGFLNKAIDEYRAAIDSDSRMEEAYSNLGGIYAAQHNYPKAMEAFEKALSLKPDRPTTLNGLGTVLYAKGKIDEAKENWRKAITVDPKFASAYYNMANALEMQKKATEAIGCYVKAIEAEPTMADAYYRIGSILNKEHHPAQAKVLLQKALDLKPDGDFARDARKVVSSLSNELAEEASADVQMNVVPPPSASASADQSAEAPAAPERPSPAEESQTMADDSKATAEESKSAPQDRRTASAVDAGSREGLGSKDQKDLKDQNGLDDSKPDKHKKGGLFKHKEKEPAKKMDMFVQPAAAQAPPEQDLKAMPSSDQ